MPRLLTTSASAYRKLLRKAELMGIDTQALEIQEAQVAALVDVRKKWHIPPAFRCVTVFGVDLACDCVCFMYETLASFPCHMKEDTKAISDVRSVMLLMKID